MSRLHARLRVLERRIGPTGGCDGRAAADVVVYRDGKLVGDYWPGAPRCPDCGEVHCRVVHEIVVRDREHLAQLRAEGVVP